MTDKSNLRPPTSLYLHFPFCRNICYYCDFNKVLLRGQPVAEYVQALCQEISLISEKTGSHFLKTIYFGGGTPSILSNAQLESIFQTIKQNFTLDQQVEITLEANPEDVTYEKSSWWRSLGINRLSLGVQSFDERILKIIGRHHQVKDVHRAIITLKKTGFTNISLDLIYSLPNQNITTLAKTLKQALSFDLPHYSLYSLILEDQTQLANFLREQKLTLPNEELSAQMMELVLETMNNASYQQYEISNFARAGSSSRHNLVYWNNEHYLGVGAGAAGYYDRIRYKNAGPIAHYLQKISESQLPVVEIERLSLKNQMEEELFLGLRKRSGVSKSKFFQKFSVDFDDLYGAVVQKLVAQGLLIDEQNQIRLTKQGLFLGNNVFAEFIFD